MTRCAADYAAPLAAGQVSVSCPHGGIAGGPADAIRQRGNLPLLICEELLAELPERALQDTWQSASAMTSADLAKYARRAAHRLARDFDSGLASADLCQVVENAAVLFVLGLRASGVLSARNIQPCTVYAKDRKGPQVVALG